MAILKITRMGHPVLRAPAQEVADPTAPEIAQLVADMAETMADAGGAGLAAPQVHVPLRIILFHVPPPENMAERYRAAGADQEPEVPLTVLINPYITPLSDEQEEAWEGCLSLPGFMGLVPRYRQIRYGGMDASGAMIERTASGFHARVVQHECDHLEGRFYLSRVRDMRNFGFAEELTRTLSGEGAGAARDSGEGGNGR